MDQQKLFTDLLLVLGGGFLFANLRILIQFLRYLKLRHSAVVLATTCSGWRVMAVAPLQ